MKILTLTLYLSWSKFITFLYINIENSWWEKSAQSLGRSKKSASLTMRMESPTRIYMVRLRIIVNIQKPLIPWIHLTGENRWIHGMRSRLMFANIVALLITMVRFPNCFFHHIYIGKFWNFVKAFWFFIILPLTGCFSYYEREKISKVFRIVIFYNFPRFGSLFYARLQQNSL